MLVSNIQRFCVHDGPGIRTTVFFKGCPLRCRWCHNPESMLPEKKVFLNAHWCVMCGACQAVCPAGAHKITEQGHEYDSSGCTGCGKCAQACPTGALEEDSREYDLSLLAEELLRDRAFYGAEGGVTFSGGEPMLQGRPLLELARLLKKEGVNIYIETSGFAPRENFESMRGLADGFLYDVKDTDNARHKRNTGQFFELSRANLSLADTFNVPIILRLIMLRGINITPEHALASAEIYKSLNNAAGLELLPCHGMGASKYKRLGIDYESIDGWAPEQEELEDFRQRLIDCGVPAIIRKW